MKPFATDVTIILSTIGSSTENNQAHLSCKFKVLPSFPSDGFDMSPRISICLRCE